MGLYALASLVVLAWTVASSTLTPPVLPLFVRNPYLSLWLQNARDVPWSRWPIFWTGGHIGFSVLASLPDTGTVYPLLGRPHDSLELEDPEAGYNVSFATYMGAQYDASTTNLTFLIPGEPDKPSARDLEIVLSFLSPITPTSTMRQALPAAYMTVHVSGTTDVDIYVDLNGQWVSGDRQSEIEWDLIPLAFTNEEGFLSWKVERQQELEFAQVRNQAEWGSLYFTAPEGVSYQCGRSSLLRREFAQSGSLQNKLDFNYRGVMEDEPVFAFSKSFKLSEMSSSSASIRFTVAHLQDRVAQFASERGLTFMRPLWNFWFPSDEALLLYHHLDFPNAYQLAADYSIQLANDALRLESHDYVDIVSLSARQVMGATSFSGTPDNPLLFLKEISSNGNTQTVDVIFPSFPFFLYTNPRWGAYLLEPLLEHQLSGQYPNAYSMHDLGAHFPNFTGHADGRDEYMPVEECGDMLIMSLALIKSLKYDSAEGSQSPWAALGSGKVADAMGESTFPIFELEKRDGISGLDDRWGGATKGLVQAQRWLERSYPILEQWTGYLVEFSLMPHNQLCTDDFAGWLALQTNLALKGIVGIKAMSELALLMGKDAEYEKYHNISDTYIAKWQELGISRDGSHAKLAYDWYGSWTTLYSLYADALLCFHPSITNSSSVDASDGLPSGLDPFSSENDDQQPLFRSEPQQRTDKKPITKDFIPAHIYEIQSDWYGAVLQKYGLPLDSRHLYTKSDWEFEAAAVASPEVRAAILARVALWVNETNTDRPFTDLYRTEGNGGFPGPNFFARPVVGGHFAFLALDNACKESGW